MSCSNGDWPRVAGEISALWLSDVLSGQMSGPVEVASLSKTRIGTGQMGECWRVEMKFDSPEASTGSCRERPNSVVVKLAATDPASRAAGKIQGCYAKEVGFYRDIQTRVEVRTPHCYFAAIAEDETNHVLVLEDVSPARQGDQLKGCSVDQASLGLEQLALFQGPLWRNPELLEIDWLRASKPEERQQVIALFCGLHTQFLQRYKEQLTPEVEQVVGWLGSNLPELPDGEDSMCLTHSDFRSDNLLFGDGVLAPKITVVDWQTLRLGPGPRDAAYFLGGSLSVEHRRKHERSLLESVYYKTLLNLGVEGLSFEECWVEYRRGALAGVMMVVLGSMMVAETDRGNEMFLTMARRHCQHALDVDAMQAARSPPG